MVNCLKKYFFLVISTGCVITVFLFSRQYEFITPANVNIIEDEPVEENLKAPLMISLARKEVKRYKNGTCPPKDNIVTIFKNGRLGNIIWEYASTWAVSKLTGLEAFIPQNILDVLNKLFDSLSFQSIEEIAHCKIDKKTFAKNLDEWKKDKVRRSLSLWGPSVLVNEVGSLVGEIRKDFVYRKELIDYAQAFLNGSNKFGNTTFVGAHIRRTDYLGYLKKGWHAKPAGPEFYLAAMEYFSNKYLNVTFIVTSDDQKWCKETFKTRNDVYISPKGSSPEQDIVILSYCNHTIYDYGTFGAWAAIYAGGETIFYNDKNYRLGLNISKVLHNWRPLCLAQTSL